MSTLHVDNWDRLLDFAGQQMEKSGVPGVALGIIQHDQVSAAGLGVTNVDHPLPVTDETLFQIGSITKTFTGTAIMRLVEMGKLALDATVQSYLPEFKVSDPQASTQSTVRNLLTHTGLWEGDVFLDTGPGDDALSRYVAEMAELKQLAPQGRHFSYCNSGFAVAGHLIERVMDMPYREALKELVLAPLELDSCFFDPGDLITYRFVVGHDSGDGDAQVLRPWNLPRAVYPVGGIVCHVKELLRYARFHLGDGTTKDGIRLLSAESLVLMHSPQVNIWGDRWMGLPWFVRELDGGRMFHHGGGTKGQTTMLALFPDQNLALAVLTNAGQGGLVTDAVVRWVAKEYLGLTVPKPEPIKEPAEELSQYAGLYQRPFAEFELGMLCGRLVGQMRYLAGFPSRDVPHPPPPPPTALELCEKDCLLATDGPLKDMLCEVVRQPDGSIGWVRAGGRLYARKPEGSFGKDLLF
jgi:CubicO group peptidase (beta-lactamase class C family)